MSQDTIGELKKFFVELLEGHDVGLDAGTPLLELGLINSMTIVELRAFIESTLDVKVRADDFVPKHLQNLETIAALVERTRASPG
jgi:acyl carrier protein